MSEKSDQSNRPTRDPRLESLRNLSRLMYESEGAIMREAMRRAPSGEAYEKRNKAAANRNATLRKLGMPEEVEGDHTGRFVNANEQVGFWQAVRNNFTPERERVVWEKRDEQGRFHNTEGPAAVTSRGTMLFMQEGAMKAGPDGFAAITPDGRAYRGEEQARSQFGHLVGLEVTQATQKSQEKAKSRKGAEAEL